MGKIRSSGPKTPKTVKGTWLQRQLSHEGAGSLNGTALLEHMSRHETPGELTRIMWYKEQSTLEHEYLLLCIKDPDYYTSSTWLRVERMGDIKQRMRSLGGNSADLQITFAPRYKDLVNDKESALEDEELEDVTLDVHPSLAEACDIVSVVHDAAPDYRLTRQNCWWLSRKVFKEVISDYVEDESEKKQLLKNCRTRASGHSSTVYNILGVVVALLASVHGASDISKVILEQAVIHNLSTKLDLRRISRTIKEQREAKRIERSQRNESDYYD